MRFDWVLSMRVPFHHHKTRWWFAGTTHNTKQIFCHAECKWECIAWKGRCSEKRVRPNKGGDSIREINVNDRENWRSTNFHRYYVPSLCYHDVLPPKLQFHSRYLCKISVWISGIYLLAISELYHPCYCAVSDADLTSEEVGAVTQYMRSLSTCCHLKPRAVNRVEASYTANISPKGIT